MTETDAFPTHLPRSLLHEAIWALMRAGHQVAPASPIFGGLWHVDRGPRLTDAQLIARAHQTGLLGDGGEAPESPSPASCCKL